MNRSGRFFPAAALAASLAASPAGAAPFSVGPTYHAPQEAPVALAPADPRLTAAAAPPAAGGAPSAIRSWTR